MFNTNIYENNNDKIDSLDSSKYLEKPSLNEIMFEIEARLFKLKKDNFYIFNKLSVTPVLNKRTNTKDTYRVQIRIEDIFDSKKIQSQIEQIFEEQKSKISFFARFESHRDFLQFDYFITLSK